MQRLARTKVTKVSRPSRKRLDRGCVWGGPSPKQPCVRRISLIMSRVLYSPTKDCKLVPIILILYVKNWLRFKGIPSGLWSDREYYSETEFRISVVELAVRQSVLTIVKKSWCTIDGRYPFFPSKGIVPSNNVFIETKGICLLVISILFICWMRNYCFVWKNFRVLINI